MKPSFAYLIAIIPLALFLSCWGCAQVDPHPDFARTADLARERTGAEQVYDPQAEELAAERVDQLLEDGVTVDEAVTIALLNNRSFQAMFEQIGASRADVVQSKLLSNPTLSTGLMFPEAGGRADLTVGFAQQLVDLWQIPVRVRMAKAQLEQVVREVAHQAVELAAEVRGKCYELLAIERTIGVVQENRDLLDRSVKLAQSQLAAGQATFVDVNLVREEYLLTELDLITLAREQDVARAELARLLGLSRATSAWQLLDELSVTHPLPDNDALLELAMRQRLDAEAAIFEARAAAAELKRQYLDVFPSITVGLAFERMEARSMPGRNVLADTARASIAGGGLTAPSIQSRAERDLERRQMIDAMLGPMIELELPIFDQNQAQIAKARYEARRKRKSLEDLLDVVARDVQRASATTRGNLELVIFYEKELLPLARENVEASRRLYETGAQNVLTFIDAQRSLIRRRKDYVVVMKDYALALTEIERAVGGRLPTENSPSATTQPASENNLSDTAKP